LRSLARVHALPVPDSCGLLRPVHPLSAMLGECERLWKVYSDWACADVAVITRVDSLFARVRAELESAWDVAPVACIVNTELNSGNFLVSPGAPVFIIDWEKPLVADPVQDLAHLLAPTTTFWKTDVVLDRSQMEGYLGGYVEAVAGRLDVRGIEDRFGRYLRMTCLRGISWCAMAQVGYAEGTHAAANADTERKIASYLTEEFLGRVAGICGFA
jgi:aminoglycoside phosphotransferase (APT) family kinase protein